MEVQKKLRAISIYLPQYHPIAENDKWWGRGFTEWRKVVKGKKIHKNQYQPHLPADLGFYDLRLPEIRQQQAQLAKENQIYGFCYYHYWFNGKLLLERPLQDVIKLKEPDFPFCICWANENWTRRWDGEEQEILIKQDYSLEDDIKHMRYLCENIFCDARYISVESKPVFIIYSPQSIPDFNKTIDIWNKTAKEYGFDGLYIIAFVKWNTSTSYANNINVNALAEFAPFFNVPPIKRTLLDKVLVKLKIPLTVKQKNNLYNYKDMLKAPKKYFDKLLYPCVTPMWDNYVRRNRGKASIYLNSTPDLYKQILQKRCDEFSPGKSDENFVFINAWNEWAEGNHLEPCEKWGDAYLKATAEVMRRF
ncbi:glycosyl hydrolase [Inquilinus sp. KBS0705]|nr:glycosyl hydrolase [Inquilinus sp. KBS0705]